MFSKALILIAVLTSLSLHAQKNKDQEPSLADAPDKAQAIADEDHAYLLRHNPFYFAYGNPLSKIQLSFKTKLVKHWPLYFAYTQLMFWELGHSSKPFRDLTFNPELFYRIDTGDHWLDNLDIGYAHDSNGKAGDVSRSYNEAYVQLNFKKELQNWVAHFSVRGGYLHAFDEGNEDIQTYVGPLTYKLSFVQLYDAWIDKSEFAIQATPGGKFGDNWGKGGYQFSWSFRLGRMNILPSFYVQYYSGYAESLLNYNQNISTFRGGLIF
jgi:phospholipase A1/A2